MCWAAAASRILMASVWPELYRLLAARLLSDLLLPAQFALMRPALPASDSAALLFAACAYRPYGSCYRGHWRQTQDHRRAPCRN